MQSKISTNPKWIIDNNMANDFVKHEIVQLMSDLGYDVTLMDHKSFYRKEDIILPYNENDVVIPYTSINLGKHLKCYYGSYLDEEALKFSNYYSKLQLPTDLWVNGDFIITTFYDFDSNYEKYVKLFQTDKLFIRPNSGSKLFTGLPIYGFNDYQYQANALKQLSGVVDNSLIMISTGKSIKEEYRFIIAGDEIVDGSQYALMGDHNERHFYTTEALNLASTIAKSKRTPVDVFTCDIAKMQDGSVKIVELNSFNCAGWYACDPKTVITKISKFVEDSYKREYE